MNTTPIYHLVASMAAASEVEMEIEEIEGELSIVLRHRLLREQNTEIWVEVQWDTGPSKVQVLCANLAKVASVEKARIQAKMMSMAVEIASLIQFKLNGVL